MDVKREMVGNLPAMVLGLHSLGSSPRQIVGMLERAGVTARHRVIDIACGKGGAAVELAERIGSRVVGVDAFEPFVEAARELSVERGVAMRCEFRVSDWRSVASGRARFDVAMMIGLLSLEEGACVLRRCVRRGGWYVIDDAVRMAGVRRGRFAETLTRSGARAFISSLGDAVASEHVMTRAEVVGRNRAMQARLTAAAERLGRERPRLRRDLAAFLHRQREATRVLTTVLRPAVWVVRRGA